MANLILVVDDNDLTRMQLRDLLEQAGYQVAQASNGKQAESMYTQLRPDMVLLDALMPEMDGFTFCAQLQTLPGGANTPVLMITGLYDQTSVEQAFAAGATDYITKPIQWQVLRQRVRRLLEARSAMEELRQQTEQAQSREAQLRMALEAARMSTWDWDILNNKVTRSDNLKAILSWESGTDDATYEAFMKRVHPQDRDFVTRSVKQALWFGAEYDIEFRVVGHDGTIHWVASKGVVFRDSSGSAMWMSGVDMDITKRKQVQFEVQRQNLRSQLFANVTLKIRESLQINDILQTSVTEVQKLLHADRVLIYRLWSDGTGSAITEAVVPGWPIILGYNFSTEVFPEEYRLLYKRGRVQAMEDVEMAFVSSCLVEFMQQWGVRAKMVVPILLKEELWGLLIAHQCAHTRKWTDWEIELLRQLADQIGIALAQAQLLEQETRHSQELSRSNEELQQFAFIASHDLQEPLRKIKTFGERLKATCGDALTEQGRDYLERMQNAAVRMQALIEDLLTLSRVTTKAQPVVPVNLTQVTQEVLSDLEVRIEQTGGSVEIGNLPTINADPLQMRQLLQNLIGNALKFHRPEEPPIVRIYSQSTKVAGVGEHCQIIVEDNGIGFDEKYLDRYRLNKLG